MKFNRRTSQEPHMTNKLMQWIVALGLCLAGLALLIAPAEAAPVAPAFTPTRFTVVDQGTSGKPDVVLIPGLASSREGWAAEARLLAPNYRLHLIQIDGFAGNPAGPNQSAPFLMPVLEEIDAYLKTLPTKPVVIGHSLGGTLGLALAIHHADDVRKLVIVDALPFYGLLFGPDATPESIKPQAEAMLKQITGLTPEQYAAMQPMMAQGMCKDPEGQKQIVTASRASDRAVVAEAMREDMLLDLRPGLSNLNVPTLLLYPSDPSFPGADLPRTDALYRAAYKPAASVTLVRIDDSRHFIQFDQPAKLDAAIEPFLK